MAHHPQTLFDTTGLQQAAGPADLRAFAERNALHFEQQLPAPETGGALFDYLQNAVIRNRFSGTIDGHGFEAGTVSGTVGGSQTKTLPGGVQVSASFQTTRHSTHGYMRMQLDRRMPHIVLDATRNDRVFGSSIPMPIAADQRLSLEGDFDSSFSLYCPTGYERDALYVMTPDLMALLVDETGDLDVEIVDDSLYLYANGAFDLTDPLLWHRLGAILGVVGAKALSQTERYVDDRSGDRAADTVARDGRRLRQVGFRHTSTLTPAKVKAIVVTGAVLVLGTVATAFILIGQAVFR